MPMKGKSAEQVKKEMQEVCEKIKTKLPAAIFIDSIIDGADKEIALKGDDMAIWYLSKSLELMADADLVFFVGNRFGSRGCEIEYQVAKSYQKLIVEWPEAGGLVLAGLAAGINNQLQAHDKH